MDNLVEEFRLSREQAALVESAKLAREAEVAAEKKAGKKTRSLGTGKKEGRRRLEHVPLNTDQLETLGLELKCVPLLILAHLEERWWKRFKRNPVKFSAFQVGGISVSGHVKARRVGRPGESRTCPGRASI
jgi:hypothetical protein